MGTWSAQFNCAGTRLLCYETNPSQLVVYELTTRQKQQPTGFGKIRLTAPNFTYKDVGHFACCFSGLQDALVVSGLDSRDLYVWSLPSDLQGLRVPVIDQPVKIFHGHQRESWRSATTVKNPLYCLMTLLVLLSCRRLVHNFELVSAFSNWSDLIFDVNVIEGSRINMFSPGILLFGFLFYFKAVSVKRI